MKRLLIEKKGRLPIEAESTHLYFEFVVPHAVTALEIQLCYDPAFCMKNYDELTELYLKRYPTQPRIADWIRQTYTGFRRCNNCLVLSVDGPDGLVGTTHRFHEGEIIRISDQEATPGYRQCETVPGKWRAVISVYSLITPVEYSLRVGLEE